MPKKKGPPYLDDPECKYVVVQNPWPAGRHGGARTDDYYEEVGAWLHYALNKAAFPETIYSRNTRADLIVKFDSNVDIQPLLGAHYWPGFLKQRQANQEISYIFEFNYRQQGHPETHNWAIHDLWQRDPPKWRGVVPFKQPYPAPTWAKLQDHIMSCKDIALPMPVPPDEPEPEPEKPPPAEAHEQPDISQMSAERQSVHRLAQGWNERQPKMESVDLRLSQTREGAAEREQSRATVARSPTAETVAEPRREPSHARGFDHSKGDPYEQDAAAAQILRGEPAGLLPVKQEPDSLPVKNEPQGPSARLLAEFDELQSRQSQGATGAPQRTPAVEVKPETGPSPALLAEMDDLQRVQAARASRSVKAEPRESAMNPPRPNYRDGPAEQTRHDQSRDPRRNPPPSRDFRGESNRFKSEPRPGELPPRPHPSDYVSRDPRQRHPDPGRSANVKREREGEDDMRRQRVKREWDDEHYRRT